MVQDCSATEWQGEYSNLDLALDHIATAMPSSYDTMGIEDAPIHQCTGQP